MRSATRSTAPHKLRKLMFGLATAGLVFVVLEILLQIFYFATVGDFLFRRTLPPIYASDPVRCYRVESNLDYVHRTNEFKTNIFTNSLGFRTDSTHREYAIDKPHDVYRILVLGPSFAFGWGSNYEEIFPTLLEQELQIPGKSVEVINVGTPSQGMAHQLCWLREVGHAYRPDLLLQVSYGRTVNPAPTACPEHLECPAIVDHQLVPPNVDRTQRLKAYFKRFALVFYGYYAYNVIVRPGPGPDQSRVLHQDNPPSGQPTADPQHIAETYAEFVDYVRSLVGPETEVAFVYLPYSYAVHAEDVARFPDVFLDDVPVTRATIEREIAAVNRRGVQILDTLPALMAAAKRERLYYWLDIHLTPAGNRVVADALVPFVGAIVEERRDSSAQQQ